MRKLHPHQEIVGLSGLTLEDFWIWAYSDLLTNTVRNAFAEFMVGFALGRLNTPRPGYDGAHFIYRDKRVDVRAAAYTQSQPQNKKSKINFDVNLRKVAPTPNTPLPAGRLRASDCFVFALFTYDDYNDKDAARNALIDTKHWAFYVLTAQQIDSELGEQKTVGVGWLNDNTRGGPVRFHEIKGCIDRALGFTD